MKYRPIIIDESLQELTEHGTDDFPISMDEQLVNDQQCATIEHWHYEVQICLVTQGAAIFRTPQGETLVREGEGFFINSGILHAPIPGSSGNNVYICVNFRPDFLHGSLNSIIRKAYVDPVLSNPALQAFALKEVPWQVEICRTLRRLAEVNQQQSYGYEIEMRNLVSYIWQLIVVNNREYVEKHAKNTFTDSQRVKALQKYIQQNYMDQITLADIAEACHVSRGECCRVFKRVTGTTPIAYLCKTRISQSIKMLSCSTLSISEIARSVGFESSSYYTVCFKAELGCTPKEFRRQRADKEGAAKDAVPEAAKNY
mgnify:CR=1 FL=1